MPPVVSAPLVRPEVLRVVAAKLFIILFLLVVALVLDGCVRPRSTPPALLRRRSWAGIWLNTLVVVGVFGTFLAICGNVLVSAVLALALVGLFTMVSNAKRAMLGEPLVFTDLALIGAIFRHPQFYLSALKPGQKAILVLAAPIVPVLLWWLSVPSWAAQGSGAALLVAVWALVRLSVQLPPLVHLAETPDVEADVQRHGLLPTLVLHHARWRKTRDPVPCIPLSISPDPRELAIVIQCESFADPVELFGNPALRLPELERAREDAWQWGNLLVSGFGAYTMRTEYGVLFGRSEAELGFRRFDPFLTALGEASYAVPMRLQASGWRSLFVHPHDLRFYNREQIMRAGGFAELVGEERFAPPNAEEGRYVTDAAIAAKIMDLAAMADAPTLIYAVTIENHGPWEASAQTDNLLEGYMRLVRNSDAMLATLRTELAGLKRPVSLVFFGDHRPSIPGISIPGGERHTPYVFLRIDGDGQLVRGEGRRIDLTPAELHHALLAVVGSPAA